MSRLESHFKTKEISIVFTSKITGKSKKLEVIFQKGI